MAKEEGLDIPADLEARLARFQEEELKEMEGKKSGKVHPAGIGKDMEKSKGGRSNLTRYNRNQSSDSAIKPFNESEMRQAAAMGMNSMYEDTMATPGTGKGKLTRFQPTASRKNKGDFNDSVGQGQTILGQDIEDSSFGGTYRKSDVGLK